MVLGRIEYLISGTNPSSSKLSNLPYGFVGERNPGDDTDHQLGYVNSGDRSSLRHATSLQDLSTYRCSDLEGGDSGIILSNSSQRENVGSSFSKVKGMNGGNPIFCKKLLQRIIILLCAVFSLLLIYFTAIYILSYWSQGTSNFYIVLDCGSTGTRVYVYKASVNQNIDESFPIYLKSVTDGHSRRPFGRAYDRMETEPGFHTYVRNGSGLKAALNPLLHWAEKQIPIQYHKSASLFLCATAGVRRLPNTDSTWLLDKTYSILKKSPFRCKREWIRIISGTEEAYYGWISLNYLHGFLGSSLKKSTFGALDLGGSSLQVTFESDNRKNYDSNLNLRIGAVKHKLHAYSLPGYGLNDAFDRSVFHLFQRTTYPELNNKVVEIKHPCLHRGYQAEYHCSHCVSRLPVALTPVGKKPKLRIHSGVKVQLIGAPDWLECKTLARAAVNLSEWSNNVPAVNCKLQPCAISDNLPKPYGTFFGMSGFYVVYRFFNLSYEDKLDDVLKKGQQFCEKTWDSAKSSVQPQPFIEQYCFRAPYTVLLLREGLNISDSQIRISSGSVTWTTGVALLEAAKSFSTALRVRKYDICGMKIPFIAIIAILFTSMLFLLCALSFVTNRIPRFFVRPYIPLVRHNSALASSVLQSPFRFRRWSPMSSDGRTKMPLSPIAGQRAFGSGATLGSFAAQPIEPGFYSSAGSAAHSYSLSNLGQMNESNSVSSFMIPRGQFRLQSRRSQSREDLSSSLADAHV